MAALSRRSFLTGAATAAGAATVGAAGATSLSGSGTRARARGKRIRLTSSTERVVIIGSGFGGGVTALRLAQAGVPVLVLERGQWWKTGPNAQTFPHAATPDKRDLFYTVTPEVAGLPTDLVPYAGILEPIVGENLTAVVAAGVGGGSLVYQGMTLQPSQAVFESLYPSIDYSAMDSTYYPRVASMLQIATAPDELINSKTYYPARQFAANVRAAGYDLTKIPMPIDWTYALDELKGEMSPSYTNGDCALGVNNGGKHSVDVTYLQQAMATGNCTVQPLSNVTDIAQASDGGWQVHVNVTDTSGVTRSQQVISTGTLVLGAGAVNTTRLLLRAAHNGTITGLPDGLGQGYGTNGDQIYVWTDLAQDLGTPQGGPVVYGSFDWDGDPSLANTVIQASMPPVSANLTGVGLPSALLPAAAQLAGLSLDTRSTMLVGYGVSDTRGSIGYNALTGQASLSWPSGGDSAIAAVIKKRITAVAGTASNLINTNDLVNSTWHSLGGACMGSVCDTEGRVQGKNGLYVLDGALQPGNTGACNPSMTIAAIAERALDQIVRNDVGSII